MDDVVERYSSEVIIDGITLGTSIARVRIPKHLVSVLHMIHPSCRAPSLYSPSLPLSLSLSLPPSLPPSLTHSLSHPLPPSLSLPPSLPPSRPPTDQETSGRASSDSHIPTRQDQQHHPHTGTQTGREDWTPPTQKGCNTHHIHIQ